MRPHNKELKFVISLKIVTCFLSKGNNFGLFESLLSKEFNNYVIWHNKMGTIRKMELNLKELQRGVAKRIFKM